jgi:anti-anti-sigma regulatory factor
VAGQVPPLLVELTWDETTATVTVHGVVDSRTAVALICHVFEIASTSRPERLILDLHHVSSADLAGAAAVGAIQAALDGKCLVIIRRPQPEMRRLIEITQWCADWLESQRPTGTAGVADVDRLDGLEVGWNEELSELARSEGVTGPDPVADRLLWLKSMPLIPSSAMTSFTPGSESTPRWKRASALTPNRPSCAERGCR